MFAKGQTVRCTDDQDAPDLYRGQCYRVADVEHGHLRLDGVDLLRHADRFEAIWPIQAGNAIETVPVTLPGGEGKLTLLRSTSRACGRRVVVHRSGRLLFDTHEQYDEGNALHALDAWLARVTEAKAIPF